MAERLSFTPVRARCGHLVSVTDGHTPLRCDECVEFLETRQRFFNSRQAQAVRHWNAVLRDESVNPDYVQAA